MAQSGEIKIKLLVDVDVSRIRRRTRRIIEETRQLNRDLAQLQERLGTLGGELHRYGIDLEVGG